jgi:hypothetical protein
MPLDDPHSVWTQLDRGSVRLYVHNRWREGTYRGHLGNRSR